MTPPSLTLPAGLLLTPGAAGDRDQAALRAIETAITGASVAAAPSSVTKPTGVKATGTRATGPISTDPVPTGTAELANFSVLRHEFAYQRKARLTGRRTPPPRVDKVVEELKADYKNLVDSLRKGEQSAGKVAPERMVLGGRSFGGRVCSMAVAQGLPAAGLILLSYPLHPPKKPEALRTEHFADINVPCLFVSGDNDPFGTPKEFAEEFDRHLRKIACPVTSLFVPGGGHDPASAAQLEQIATAVTSWLSELDL